ncbi:MAG: response regulator [Verrucomicrobiaceae bacterium]|nr:response regulator [Verrucomicrobiaceae bacterium]
MNESSPNDSDHEALLRVLVVDDNRGAAEGLAMFFEREGGTARVAEDGVEAISQVEAFDPQVVFMDLEMPRMDGYEAAQHIRAHNPRIVLVALTGSNDEKAIQRTVEAGYDLHLAKPSTPAALRGVLERYFPKY